MTKDQFIFEALKEDGDCWHIWKYINGFRKCTKCRWMPEAKQDKYNFGEHNPDFTTWEGFGKLWEAIGGIRGHFLFGGRPKGGDYYQQILDLIHPTRFRDAIADFLGWEGE